VIARRGLVSRLSAAADAAFGTPLPTAPRVAVGRGMTFAWSGPDSWLAEAHDDVADLESLLMSSLDGLAAVCEQTDSRVVVELCGPRVREVLCKGVPVDLHPHRFRTHDVALTAVGHISIHLRQVSDEPAYRIGVAGSFFASFWHWLESSAAEFGYDVTTPDSSETRR
jgi:sarcosine oxidase subunit gamma